MFGRIREEDYDEYNERINSKYDDDYVRPTRESRQECAHSHGQTYRNYDVRETHSEYREECSHDHEQTYEDYNSEQRSYDVQSGLSDRFSKYLAPNEQIIWCGKPEPNLTPEESGAGCTKGAGIMLLCAGIPMLIIPFIGIFFIVIGAALIKNGNVKNRSYAITTERLMVFNGASLRSTPLKIISNVTFRKSARNIGYVSFMKRSYSQGGRQSTLVSDGIFGIKDPAGVCRLLKDSVISANKIQGVQR